MLSLCNCTIYMIMQRPVSAFAKTPSSISSYFLFNINKQKIIKLFIIQVNGFMQSRESDAPPTRSERLAKRALYNAQVIYTCMSLQFIQMAVSCILHRGLHYFTHAVSL